MTALTPARARRATIAAIGLLVAVTTLAAGCTTPDDSATAEVGDVVLSVGIDLLDEPLPVRMPDGVYVVAGLTVLDDAFADGEVVRAPEGASLVQVSLEDGEYAGEWAPVGTSAVLRVGDTEVSVDLDDPSDGLVPVVVVPGDGSDAELVLTYESRSATVSVATLEVVDAPFVETLVRYERTELGPLPPAGWSAIVEAKLMVDVRLISYLPDRGWAPEGETWVEGRVDALPGSLVPVAEGDHDGVPVVCTVGSVGIAVDGVASPLEITPIEGGGVDGMDALRIVGTVPAGTTSFELRVDYTLTADGEVRVDQTDTWVSPLIEPDLI